MQEKHRQQMGTRYVEVFRSTKQVHQLPRFDLGSQYLPARPLRPFLLPSPPPTYSDYRRRRVFAGLKNTNALAYCERAAPGGRRG